MRKMLFDESFIQITLDELIEEFVQRGYKRTDTNTVSICGTKYTITESEFPKIFKVTNGINSVFVTKTNKGIRMVQRWITFADPFDLIWDDEDEPLQFGLKYIIENAIMHGGL